jgi:hypothetical protein
MPIQLLNQSVATSKGQPNKERFPTTCRRSYRLKANSADEKLANYLQVHSYLGGGKGEKLDKMSGSPLVQFRVGEGTIVASELELNIATKDPISGKTLANLIEMLTSNETEYYNQKIEKNENG